MASYMLDVDEPLEYAKMFGYHAVVSPAREFGAALQYAVVAESVLVDRAGAVVDRAGESTASHAAQEGV